MRSLLPFGEKVADFDYRVINEREARASAGIMFLLGLLSLFSVYLERTIFWAEFFSITFIIEFVVRVLIHPRYAPYMLVGALIVSNQAPEWVEARPKHFAWSLGLVLGLLMTYYIVFDLISPIRMAICWLCLFLMFVESAFGICLGCLLYQQLNWKTYRCPGAVCDTQAKRPYDRRNLAWIVLFLLLFGATYAGLRTGKFSEKPRVVIVNE